MLTGTLTEKGTLGRPKRKWEDNIRMYLKGICINGLIRLRIGIVGDPL